MKDIMKSKSIFSFCNLFISAVFFHSSTNKYLWLSQEKIWQNIASKLCPTISFLSNRTLVLIALILLGINISAPVLAQQNNDITNFRVVSETQNYLEFEIEYYYNGGFGPAWMSVEPTLRGQRSGPLAYFPCGGENNSINVGQNRKCMSVKIVGQQHPIQFSTDFIEVCLFSGVSTAKYCESYSYLKQWSSGQ